MTQEPVPASGGPPAPLIVSTEDSTEAMRVDASGKVGIGTPTPRNPVGIRATGTSQELLSFEDPSGVTKWHINQDLNNNSGLNFVETGVADGRLFIQAGGNVGIGMTNPQNQLVVANKASFGGNTANTGSEPVEVQGPGAGVSFYDRTAGAAGRWVIYSNRWGGPGTEALRFWSNNTDHLVISPDGTVDVNGNFNVHGKKNFVQEHPSDPTRQIVYVSLEGGEAGTYIRGTWKLEDGKAMIDLPEHFGMVTSEDGLSIQLTPRGEWLQLYVVRLTTGLVVISEAQEKSGQFDYFIQGVRKGFEHHEVIQEKK